MIETQKIRNYNAFSPPPGVVNSGSNHPAFVADGHTLPAATVRYFFSKHRTVMLQILISSVAIGIDICTIEWHDSGWLIDIFGIQKGAKIWSGNSKWNPANVL